MTLFRLKPDDDRPSGLRVLSVAGIPIYIEFGFILFLGLFCYVFFAGRPLNYPAYGLFCFLIFISILVHELGHALTSKWLGCDSIRIALVMFGGYATHSPTTRGKSLLITLAGPFSGLALFGLIFLLSRNEAIYTIGPKGAMGFVIAYLLWMNLWWSLFNLIPIHPMDGGQALYHALTFWLASDRAMLWVAKASMVMCVIIGAIGFNTGYTFIALFCLMFFFNNLHVVKALS